MAKITISYRREDSGVITGRIFDRLVAHFGADTVFRDIDNIPPGIDFRKYITDALERTDILLAIVGPHWSGKAPDGTVRITEPNDLVRIEVEAALRKDIPVIPVLVSNAIMPQPNELPEPLQGFAYRNALRIDALEDFDDHVHRLIRSCDRLLPPKPDSETKPQGERAKEDQPNGKAVEQERQRKLKQIKADRSGQRPIGLYGLGKQADRLFIILLLVQVTLHFSFAVFLAGMGGAGLAKFWAPRLAIDAAVVTAIYGLVARRSWGLVAGLISCLVGMSYELYRFAEVPDFWRAHVFFQITIIVSTLVYGIGVLFLGERLLTRSKAQL